MTRDELIAALEKATGEDRNLDAALHAFINGGYVEAAGRPNNRAVIWHKDRGVEPALISGFPNMTREMLCYADQSPRYTASRDAMLPGAEKLSWTIRGPIPFGSGMLWHVMAVKYLGDDQSKTDFLELGEGATEPLARRIAEIKALIRS